MGSTLVRPGDWVFGDVDGVVIIPADLVEDVLAEAEERAGAGAQIPTSSPTGALPSEVYARLGTF